MEQVKRVSSTRMFGSVPRSIGAVLAAGALLLASVGSVSAASPTPWMGTSLSGGSVYYYEFVNASAWPSQLKASINSELAHIRSARTNGYYANLPLFVPATGTASVHLYYDTAAIDRMAADGGKTLAYTANSFNIYFATHESTRLGKSGTYTLHW